MSNGKLLSFLLLAAVMGSALTLGVYRYAGIEEKATVLTVAHESAAPAVVSGFDENGDQLPTFTYAAEKVMPSVVHIKSTVVRRNTSSQRNNVPDPFRDFFGDDFFSNPNQQRSQRPQVGTGSGVIISTDGYIVTNNHVIDGAQDIEVSLSDNQSYKATLIGTDPSTDIALIKIDVEDLPAITLGNSDEVRVGEWVLAIGNPFNLNSTVTAGIVSATARNINILRDQRAIESFIQTDAAVNPGNSGGALVDLNGNLIGINTAIASPTGSYSGYSFAVPVTIVRKVMEDLLQYGTVQRGFLGVIIRTVDGNLARAEGFDFLKGVYVDSLMNNGAAKDAGVEKGDVIVSVNDRDVNTSSQLQAAVGTLRPGDEVNLTVMRDGEEKDLTAILRNQQGNTDIVKKEEEVNKTLATLGLELENLDARTARQLDLSGGIKVTDIEDGIVSSQTRMRKGFVITHVDGKEVETVSDLEGLLTDKKGGVMLEGVYEDQPGRYYYAFGM